MLKFKNTYFGIFIAFVTLVLVLSACNKPVYKYNPDFEGTWRTIPVYDSVLNYISTSEIIINGPDGSYKNSCSTCGTELCACISVQSGKAEMNDTKTEMRMGSKGFGLSIDEEPNIDANGAWTMVIQGLRYYKQ
ncbi:MAG: hypothetical protein A3D92_15885 [Bacteroidetes bacterium RIFCSPHIGHO2_02_FULL_44_7]|nr:MAG: hypothetical protein A3D92_15885 [Bacteroidetes bacterium RIFCSPHIGHO2_02_FULL_44_7]